MPNHELPTTQKNALLDVIRAEGLDPQDFSWEEVLSSATLVGAGRQPYTVERLLHRPTGYWFKFDVDANRSGSLWAEYLPSSEGSARSDHAGSWAYVFGYFQEWAGRVAREHQAPNLWAEVGRERELVAPPQADENNTRFSAQELALVRMQLRELKELLTSSYDLDHERARQLATRVEYLEGAAERVGRLDWRQILVAELLGLVIRAVVPEGAFREGAHFLARGIGHLFSGGFPELPGA